MKWGRVKLKSIAEIVAGQSPESKYYNQAGEGIAFFQGKADFGYENPTVRYWCTNPTKIAHPYDILLSVRAPVGPTNICDIECCIGRGLAAIRVGPRVLYKYLYWWFKSNEHRLAHMGNGSTFAAITTNDVKNLLIPLPPLHIQEQIADTLDKADALRRKDQELLQKYDELAQAIFFNMFGDPVRNKKGWEVTCLKNLIRIETKSIKPEETNGKLYVGLENIEKDTGRLTISSELELKSNKFVFDDSCILYGKLRPYLRKVATPNFSGICSTDIFPIRPVKLTREFAVRLLRSQHFTDYANSSSVGANLPRVNKEAILSYETICPPPQLQAEYENAIKKINQQVSLLEKSVQMSDDLYSAVLLQCFT